MQKKTFDLTKGDAYILFTAVMGISARNKQEQFLNYDLSVKLLSIKKTLQITMDALEEANAIVDFTFGLFFALTALIVPREYRMQAAKLFEALLLCYLPFKAAYFRHLLQKFLDSRRQTLRIYTTVAQKSSQQYRKSIEI